MVPHHPALTAHPEHTSPDPPMLSPSWSFHWLLMLNTKSCCWQAIEIHSFIPLGHHPGQHTHTSVHCFFSHHRPFGWPHGFIPNLAAVPAVFLSSSLSCCNFSSSIYVYSITTYCNSGLWEGFCKFYCCTPIKLLRTRAPVKLMKCKCQSFWLPPFLISSAVVLCMLWYS